jgi:glutamate synthase (NADPH/NADH) large chain
MCDDAQMPHEYLSGRCCHTDEELRKKFVGRYEYLVNFFRFMAQNVREHLAELGFRSLDEIIGRSDLLVRRHYPESEKSEKIDLSRIIVFPEEATKVSIRKTTPQQHKIDEVLDRNLIRQSISAIEFKQPSALFHQSKHRSCHRRHVIR